MDLGKTPAVQSDLSHSFSSAETMAAAAGAPQRVETLASDHEPARRLLSLDALRGITIAFMIMVNNHGGPAAWAEMKHSVWSGLTATDLVFPTFLFVVGISIVFAFEGRLARGATRMQLARHLPARAAILIAFGIVVNSFPFFQLVHMRFYGVLQRIALCYLVVGLFYLWDRRASTKIIALVGLLLGYWVVMRWFPVPGAGVPGRDIPFLDHNQNLVAWLDRHLMPGHLYEDAPLYSARDPEGLLSTLPAIGTTLIGLLTGIFLRSRRSTAIKTAGLMAGSAACLTLGYFWSIWFPLNKKLWTSSYVLASAGWSLAVLALFYWAMEQKGWCREGRSRAPAWPWLVFGSNAIVAYMISDLLASTLRTVLFQWHGLRMNPLEWSQWLIFSHIPDSGWAAFAYSVTFTALCFLPVWALYRKKIFLKV